MLAYKLIRVEHPSNQKRGGICIIYEYFFPIKANNISYLNEYLSFNLSENAKQCNIPLIYCSPIQPIQWPDEFYTFTTNFELLLDNTTNRNPSVSIIKGYLDVMTKKWCSNHEKYLIKVKILTIDFTVWT